MEEGHKMKMESGRGGGGGGGGGAGGALKEDGILKQAQSLACAATFALHPPPPFLLIPAPLPAALRPPPPSPLFPHFRARSACMEGFPLTGAKTGVGQNSICQVKPHDSRGLR